MDLKNLPQTYAVVSQNMSYLVKFCELADTSRKFTGHFDRIQDAIDAVPEKFRIIKVQITDDDGKDISYTINRDAH